MIFTIHTDGGSRGNPGPAAIGVVIERENVDKTTFGKYIGITTNNTAEYTAVLETFVELLKTVEAKDRGEVHFFLDSLLVVSQLTGRYRIKDTVLARLFMQIKLKEQEWGRSVSYQHIPRSQNAAADKLVNQALDQTLYI